MKKIIIFIFSIVIIVLAVFSYWFINKSKENMLTKNFNSEYEIYMQDKINGVELTTLINKAIDNNEKYNIKKDDKNLYIPNEESSLKIYIKITSNSDFYPMEAFYSAGISDFTMAYGTAEFKCTSIEFHENQKISKIFFEIIE